VALLLRDAHADDEFFAYVDGQGMLLGVLHRSGLVDAVAGRDARHLAQQAAQLSMRRASSRAYGALERALMAKHSTYAARQPSVREGASSDGRETQPAQSRGAPLAHRAAVGTREGPAIDARDTPFGSNVEVQLHEINSIRVLAEESMQQQGLREQTSPDQSPARPKTQDGDERQREPSLQEDIKGISEQEAPSSQASSSAACGGAAQGGDGSDGVPPSWMAELVPRSVWEGHGLDTAPITVQATAPMHLVHFYFSQLTLNCVFVVDRGVYVGMINKSDMMRCDL